MITNEKGYVRWMVYAVLCFCMFTYNYCYDNPAALIEQLINDVGLSNVEYNLLYSVYAWPNIFVPIITGILVDWIGINTIIIIMFTLVLLGHGIFIWGVSNGNFMIMIIGRLIFGIGAESFEVAETPLIIEYFKGKELSFALGLNLSFSRIGSSINQFGTYVFYSNFGLIWSLLFGLILMLCSFITLYLLILYRVINGITFKQKMNNNIDDSSKILDKQVTYDTISNNNGMDSPDKTMDIISFQSGIDSNTVISDKDTMSIVSIPLPKVSMMETKKSGNDFKLSNVLTLDSKFWLLCLLCCTMYGCVSPWMNIGAGYLQDVYGYSHQRANSFLMIPYLFSGICTPLCGYMVDKIGKRCQLLLISCFVLIITHTIFLLSWESMIFPIIALLLLGVSFSIFAGVIWPAFSIIVKSNLLGFAYGFGVASYNAFLGIFYVIVGTLIDDNESNNKTKYNDVQISLLFLSLTSGIIVIVLWIKDSHTGDLLNEPTIKQNKIISDDISEMTSSILLPTKK